jgi:hypothetical protein
MSTVVKKATGIASDLGNVAGFYNPGGQAGAAAVGAIAGPMPEAPAAPAPLPPPPPPLQMPRPKKPVGYTGQVVPPSMMGGTIATSPQGLTSPALTGGKTLLGA